MSSASSKAWWQRGNDRDLGPWWAIILTTFAIFLLSQFAAAFVVGLGYGVSHPHRSVTDALSGSAPVQFFYVALAELLAVAMTVFVVRKVRRLSLSVIGLGRKPQSRDIIRAILGAGAFYL